ncbi:MULTISPECIES: hypothetical protein [Brevibacillus]|nr:MULTISPECIES: hypothetical protein [Brevibacillus]MBG9789315.1 hypothetical protein [Brevibacillus laterosporus]MED1789103.1 hypothetical protein [Brevibacillus laterosporus]RFB34933.1 hypothetical protein DZB91_10410 [Brevibacillus sp. VP]
MAILTRRGLSKMEEYYYWSANRTWSPFSLELKEKLFEIYGGEPFLYTWTEQDIHEGARKIIKEYFKV